MIFLALDILYSWLTRGIHLLRFLFVCFIFVLVNTKDFCSLIISITYQLKYLFLTVLCLLVAVFFFLDLDLDLLFIKEGLLNRRRQTNLFFESSQTVFEWLEMFWSISIIIFLPHAFLFVWIYWWKKELLVRCLHFITSFLEAFHNFEVETFPILFLLVFLCFIEHFCSNYIDFQIYTSPFRLLTFICVASSR